MKTTTETKAARWDSAIRVYALMLRSFEAHDYSVKNARAKVLAATAHRFAYAIASLAEGN